MKQLFRVAPVLIALFVSPVQAEDSLSWEELIDAEARLYEDPYIDLSSRQLEDLSDVVRLRARLEESGLAAQERTELEAKLRRLETGLGEAGIDVDGILAQRWVVAERRERAATAGNTALDGAKLTLAGYAIPAPPAEDGTPVAYLVPERGMCSHMPPPSPNQMVRVRLNGDWTPQYTHEPVQLTGTLCIAPSSHRIRVVDGEMAMRATYRMDAVSAKTLGFASLASVSAWARAAALHKKFESSGID
jgi:hypothetical protein